jgi:hypothetical protein
VIPGCVNNRNTTNRAKRPRLAPRAPHKAGPRSPTPGPLSASTRAKRPQPQHNPGPRPPAPDPVSVRTRAQRPQLAAGPEHNPGIRPPCPGPLPAAEARP